jgi:hypothetical protein
VTDTATVRQPVSDQEDIILGEEIPEREVDVTELDNAKQVA